ncbi:MAG: alanine racemase [Gammaproteobacteria bacterium]|nr:MAG: alanine racemase [Gammaproteobacteria bacterium]
MKRAAFARINLAHLKYNLASIRTFVNQSQVMAVVKADAYGHGVLEVCRCLSDADAFSVAYVNEALELRESGIKKPIVALQGFSSTDELRNAIEHKVHVVLHHKEQLKILQSNEPAQTLNVLLKIDTGMHRLGFAAEKFKQVLDELKSLLSPESTIRLMTHLACADEVKNPQTQQQLDQFDLLVKNEPYAQSIANSAAILAWPEAHRDWVRPGLALYGVNPLQNQTRSSPIELRPVMSLHAPLISIKHCKKGEKVGYGGDFCCPSDMVIGIIAIGYADGYPQHLKSSPSVSINAEQVPLVGRVSMDMIAVDLSGVHSQVGEIAELWGESISVTDVAEHAETISYELLCAAGNSAYKKYIQ